MPILPGPERPAFPAHLLSGTVNVRIGARVILIDPARRVLLVGVTDPVDGRRIWMTPGGGCERGENDADCALRELREESGISATGLRGPVFEHEHVFRWAGRVHRQRERFFVASLDGSTEGEPSPDDVERAARIEARWWTIDQLRTTGEVVEPPDLHDIVAKHI